jgi:SNF2 family DNA or RNA helicase
VTFAFHKYQVPMLDFVLDDPTRKQLWGGMGLGKTLIAATALDYLSYVEPNITLVLAPKRVAQSTWPDELKKWPHLRGLEISVIVGNEKERIAALERDANIFTTNYENIPWLVEHLDGKWPFTTVIADESTKLKNLRLHYQTSKLGKVFLNGQGGVRAKAIGKLAHDGRVKRWLNLTGTPAPNGYLDLWGQTWFLDGGVRLGRLFSSYQQRYFETEPRPKDKRPGPWKLRDFGKAQIDAKLADITLSVEAKDHFDLPPLITNVIYFDLPSSVRKMYREMEKKLYTELEGKPLEAFNAGAKSQKLLQIASGAVYLDPELGEVQKGPKNWKQIHDCNLQILDSVVSEAAGMPVLVAYHLVSERDRLLSSFPSARLLDDNPGTITEWNNGRIPLLLAHPKSAGHGLNLQDGGNILFFFGHDWNLEEWLQIIERIGPTRQMQSGHNRSVYLHYAIARDTIQEQVMERREGKREVQDLLMEAMKRRNR